MVPASGLEPERLLSRGILSPLCLPNSTKRAILSNFLVFTKKTLLLDLDILAYFT